MIVYSENSIDFSIRDKIYNVVAVVDSWLGMLLDKNRLSEGFPRITQKNRKPLDRLEEFRALVPRAGKCRRAASVLPESFRTPTTTLPRTSANVSRLARRSRSAWMDQPEPAGKRTATASRPRSCATATPAMPTVPTSRDDSILTVRRGIWNHFQYFCPMTPI